MAKTPKIATTNRNFITLIILFILAVYLSVPYECILAWLVAQVNSWLVLLCIVIKY
jgi:hypothetical protein